MFTLDLTGQVPIYGQEQCNWCGAASAQMVLNGYPPPNPSIFFTQTDIWNGIQARNAEPAAWATDPTGLLQTLRDFNPPPPPYTWDDFSNTNRDTVLHGTLYWMAQLNYPAPTLINSGGHWVAIVGYETDIDPRLGTATLNHITVNDPEPHNVGSQNEFTGAGWLAGPWSGSNIYGTIWLGKWVTIVEPPTKSGKVIISDSLTMTGKIITPEQAVEAALQHIKERRLAARKQYSMLAVPDFKPFDEPFLVAVDPRPLREAVRGPLKLPRVYGQYYLVPFGYLRELEKGLGRMMRLVVVVNAYKGEFIGVTKFGRAVRMLSEREAIDIAYRALSLKEGARTSARARLVFRPSKQTHIVTFPVWEIAIGKNVLFIDQLGYISQILEPSIPGD